MLWGSHNTVHKVWQLWAVLQLARNMSWIVRNGKVLHFLKLATWGRGMMSDVYNVQLWKGSGSSDVTGHTILGFLWRRKWWLPLSLCNGGATAAHGFPRSPYCFQSLWTPSLTAVRSQLDLLESLSTQSSLCTLYLCFGSTCFSQLGVHTVYSASPGLERRIRACFPSLSSLIF